jgi:signal peptidase I
MEPQNRPQNPLEQEPTTPTLPPTVEPPQNPALAEILQPNVTPEEASDSQTGPGALQTVANSFKAVVFALFSWVIFPIAVVLLLHNFVFQAYHVLGTSMVPTLHETDYLIVSKLGDTSAMVQGLIGKHVDYIPSRGQIIVFHYPQDPTKVFVKRVVGLPGDRIVIKSGTVTIFDKASPNGFNPDAKYEPSNTATLIDTDETVQPGNIFVMGDNRTPGGSFDSREWGQLPSSYIIGDAVLRLLPLNDTKVF